MTEAKASQLNPLTLAFMGDGVYTLYVREYALRNFDLKANKMDAYCRNYVKAASQAVSYKKVEPLLTELELGIAKRARNSHPQNKAKNASNAEYMSATALEAVIGFLYITDNKKRLDEIVRISMNAVGEKDEQGR